MKIYLASSWKMKDTVLIISEILRNSGHEVDAFCDETNRISFNWNELIEIMKNEGTDIQKITAIEMMQHWRVQEAFKEDKKWIDWADAVIMLMPCGRSAHLEAGYAVGSGKRLYIIGGFEKGEFETMYGFAHEMYTYNELEKLIMELSTHNQ